MTVREGWVVFSPDGRAASRDHNNRIEAWDEVWKNSDRQFLIENMQRAGYTCRRVRVTIDELEQGESDAS